MSIPSTDPLALHRESRRLAELRQYDPAIAFARHDRGAALAAELGGMRAEQELAAFSRGFYKVEVASTRVRMADLRMGQEPHYVFSFVVAARHSALQPLDRPVAAGSRHRVDEALPWLWRRLRGEPVPPWSRLAG